ncbi:hypothetical protein FQN54_005257 [Arachnomyces sp. PD_36]|nr:hypothetical protein FQN54_005257 [Arachnomyces sp. PD_36]
MGSSRNIYESGVDFAALALQSPDFAKHIKKNSQLDFNNPDSVRQLTKSLLSRDFGVDIDLPDDRLCPPVPNRLNYILWLQDLIDTTSDDYQDQYDPDRRVVGLDIGTGSNIDDKNAELAGKNVIKNNLQSRIRVVKTTKDDDLIPLKSKIGLESLDFVMCNPPFYESRQELVESAAAKQRPPFSACTGAEVEMVTHGGEVAFVSRIIAESLRLQDAVQWYSSMFGKASSVTIIVEKLMEAGNTNWAVTEFIQGNKTRRWAVAWSWEDRRPSMKVARGVSGFPKHFLPFPSEFLFHAYDTSIDILGQKIDSEMQSLDAQWSWKPSTASGLGFAMGNVWSRQARRKKKQQQQQNASAGNQPSEYMEPEIDEDEAALGFGIQLRQSMAANSGDVEVLVRWFKGSDAVLFESFCGMVKRKFESR